MIDRLVWRRRGNPDPTTTRGKDAEPSAKALEANRLGLPEHLIPRYGLVVHGDVAGIEGVRRGFPTGWTGWV